MPKISQLPAAGALDGTEIVPIVQAGNTDETTTQDIANLAPPYVLPTASAGTLGGVKVGTGLSIDGTGILSNSYTLPTASGTVLGGIKIGSGLSIDGTGIVTAQSYTLPIASGSTLGGVKIGTGLAIDGTGIVSVTSGQLESYQNAAMGVSVMAYVWRDGSNNITKIYEPVRNNTVYIKIGGTDRFLFDNTNWYNNVIDSVTFTGNFANSFIHNSHIANIELKLYLSSSILNIQGSVITGAIQGYASVLAAVGTGAITDSQLNSIGYIDGMGNCNFNNCTFQNYAYIDCMGQGATFTNCHWGENAGMELYANNVTYTNNFFSAKSYVDGSSASFQNNFIGINGYLGAGYGSSYSIVSVPTGTTVTMAGDLTANTSSYFYLNTTNGYRSYTVSSKSFDGTNTTFTLSYLPADYTLKAGDSVAFINPFGQIVGCTFGHNFDVEVDSTTLSTINLGGYEIGNYASSPHILKAGLTGFITTNFSTLSAAPTIDQVPSNMLSIIKNTTDNTFNIWVNDNGTIKGLIQSGGTYTASKGITLNGSDFELGGAFVDNNGFVIGTASRGTNAYQAYLNIYNGLSSKNSSIEVGSNASLDSSNAAIGNINTYTDISNSANMQAISSLAADLWVGTEHYYSHIDLQSIGGTGAVTNSMIFTQMEDNGTTTTTLAVTMPAVTAVSGNKYLPLSVNGTFADAAGNIAITTGGAYTASNGLTLSGSDFQLGGSLTVDTTLTASTYQLTINGSHANAFVFNVTNSLGGGINVSATGGNGINTSTTDQNAIFAQATAGGGVAGYFTSANGTGINVQATLPLRIQSQADDTATVLTAMSVIRNVATVGATGMGSSFDFYNATTVNSQLSNQIITKWSDGTDATRTSEFSIIGVGNAVTNTLLTLSGSGATKLNKYGAGTFTGTATYNLAVDSTGNVIEVATGGGGGASVVTMTLAQANTAISGATLIPGQLYKITGVDSGLYGGTDIFLTALTTNSFSKRGTGVFYNPKYDNATAGTGYGIWTTYMNISMSAITGMFQISETVTANNGATATYLAEGFFQWLTGDWSAATSITGGTSAATATVSGGVSPSYAIGAKVIWGGKHWTNVNGNVGASTDDYTLNAEWSVVSFNSTDYNVVLDEIEYDFDSDFITYRKDKFNNEVSCTPHYRNASRIPIKVFQWGSGLETNYDIGAQGNIVKNSQLNCLNSLAQYIWSMTVLDSSSVVGNVFSKTAYLERNFISESSGISYNNFGPNTKITQCNILNGSAISSNYLGDSSIIDTCTFTNGSTLGSMNLIKASYIEYCTFTNNSNPTLTSSAGFFIGNTEFVSAQFSTQDLTGSTILNGSTNYWKKVSTRVDGTPVLTYMSNTNVLTNTAITS